MLPDVEEVARRLEGIDQIGVAHRLLADAGHAATLTANRITIDDAMVALRVTSDTGTAKWVVYALDGTTVQVVTITEVFA